MSNATLTLTLSPTENVIKADSQLDGHDPSKLISMRNIWKTYQMGTESVHALHGVSFDIPRGEYIAIIGPSGSGKSTLMNLIGCLDTPTQGEYWLNGKNVSDMDDDELARIRNQEVGFVFQTFNLLARATALHNVELPLIYGGVSSSKRHAHSIHTPAWRSWIFSNACTPKATRSSSSRMSTTSPHAPTALFPFAT